MFKLGLGRPDVQMYTGSESLSFSFQIKFVLTNESRALLFKLMVGRYNNGRFLNTGVKHQNLLILIMKMQL